MHTLLLTRFLNVLLPCLLTALPLRAAETLLDQVDDIRMTSGWDGHATLAGRAVSGKPLTLGGRTFAHGLGTHAPSNGLLKLDGRATRFTATIGVDAAEAPGSVRFIVRGDGRVLFDSGLMRGTDKPRAVDVSLKGVRMLQLETTDGGDGNHNDHADWADARVHHDGAKPQWIAPDTPVPHPSYPDAKDRRTSPGATRWYVNPAAGDDQAAGTSPATAFRSFAGLNRWILAPGDTVLVAPGRHTASLLLEGKGTDARPITVRFLPGRHVFAHGDLAAQAWHISNTNDTPHRPKAIAIWLREAGNVRLEGQPGSEIVNEGKAIYLAADHSARVAVEGLVFDYATPTVCEFTIAARTDRTIDIDVQKDARYRIQDGRMTWTGPGWEFGVGGFIKVLDPATGGFSHGFDTNGRFEELAPGKVRITYAGKAPDIAPGRVIQNRNITRDCVGFLNRNSKDIAWRGVTVHAMHGMGVVSQFSENLSFEKVRFEPRKGSGRTNVTWADVLHFSGCRGHIRVRDCVLGYSHDDAINVHGTHLRIVGTPGDRTLRMRFEHGQTYGIDGFLAGDDVDFVHADSLVPYASGKVAAVRRINDKEMELDLAGPLPGGMRKDDVLENVTWTPSVHVSGTVVRNVPTRGFLLTTRRPVLIEGNRFERTGMPAILIEDDASGWFESGVVRDMRIRGNTFVRCGEPAICIDPKVRRDEGPVHRNIRIEGNRFDLSGNRAVSSRHCADVQVGKNTFERDGKPLPESSVLDIRN